MNRFIKNLFLFMLPVFILGGLMEGLIRKIPNDYAYKRAYLDKNAGDIEVLFLGSSHAYRDIDPALLRANSFNAAYVSQSLYYDDRILQRYESKWLHLKYIVVSISYFSLFNQLEESPEAWRVKNYSIYYSMKTSSNIADYSEMLSNKLDINLERINAYYLLGQTNLTSSKLGWGQGFRSDVKLDLEERGRVAAERHTRPNDIFFDENVSILKSMIAFAAERDIQVIFYTPPAYQTYVEHLDARQLDRTISTMTALDRDYPNVTYVNFLTSRLFQEGDFYDADHLNEKGAKKFTLEIGKLIDIKK